MNIKKATNLQRPTESLKKTTKQPTSTGTESQIQRSFGGLSAGRTKSQNGGKGTGIKKHKWQLQNRQGDIKNGIGNGEAKELVCMTHGHELRREIGTNYNYHILS